MTKIECIDIVRNIIAPTDNTEKFRRGLIEMALNTVYNQILSTMTPEQASDFLSTYSKEYTSQSVTLDATKNKYYTTIPAKTVPFNGSISPILHVNTNAGFDLDFVPMDEDTYALLGGLNVQLVDSTIGYIVRADKIWYNDSMSADIVSAGVRLVVVIQFSEFDSTDFVPIPGGRYVDLIQGAVQILMNTQPQNLKNDN